MSTGGVIRQYDRCLYTAGKLVATYPCEAMLSEDAIWKGSFWEYNNQVSIIMIIRQRMEKEWYL